MAPITVISAPGIDFDTSLVPTMITIADIATANGLMRKLLGHSKHDNDHEQRPALTSADHDSSVWGNTRAGSPAAQVC
jgi:hypothetical protein